ncbi:MAG: hypothetical protein Q8K97_01465 [Pseudohongiella sp.]|nr:hypothetical protein [Pseudohongiella sp.]
MNVKFNYLYRDAGNYKEYGSVVFAAPNQIDLADIDRTIRDALIDREYFVAKTVGIPDLKKLAWDEEIDHSWHEYEGLELTNEACNDEANRDIGIFISSFNLLQKY